MTTKDELHLLRHAIDAMHWMARRYADGRQSYATGMLNDTTRGLLRAGVKFTMPDGTPWARDAMGRGFDGLSDEEAALGKRFDCADAVPSGLRRSNAGWTAEKRQAAAERARARWAAKKAGGPAA